MTSLIAHTSRLNVASGSSFRSSPGRGLVEVAGVAAAAAARARGAAGGHVGALAERDRAGRQSAEPVGAVEDLAPALTVLEAVTQLQQFAAACRERGEKSGGRSRRG